MWPFHVTRAKLHTLPVQQNCIAELSPRSERNLPKFAKDLFGQLWDNTALLVNNMATQKHAFKVEMTCEGCSGAVTRVLNKLGDQVAKFDIDLPNKKVVIESALSSDQLLETLKKTGKETTYIGQE